MMILVCGLFAAIGLILVAEGANGSAGPGPFFITFWFAIVLWNGYWWLYRVATELRLDTGYLTWETPLRHGSVPLAAIKAVRPMRLGSNIQIFELTDGRPIMVMTKKGLRAFTDELARSRPDLAIRFGWQARLVERMPGRSRSRPL